MPSCYICLEIKMFIIMKNILKLFLLFTLPILIIGCGGSDEKKSKKEKVKIGNYQKKKTEKKEEVKENKTHIGDLENKGVGPIKSVTLGEIDSKMADEGKAIFKAKCTACHKIGKKFIGPDLTGVTKRQSPEWIMNMILNPDEMVKKDPDAKALLIEFNGSPMANQSLKEEEARKILEYFRTLE